MYEAATMKATTEAEGCSLLFCDGWDYRLGEPLCGGRCVEVLPDFREGLAAARAWARVAVRAWGPGWLYLVGPGPDHRLRWTNDPAGRGRPGVMTPAPMTPAPCGPAPCGPAKAA